MGHYFNFPQTNWYETTIFLKENEEEEYFVFYFPCPEVKKDSRVIILVIKNDINFFLIQTVL